MGVEFEEKNDFKRPNFNKPQSGSRIGTWLVAKGLVKDEASAMQLQVIVAVILIAIALFIIIF